MKNKCLCSLKWRYVSCTITKNAGGLNVFLTVAFLRNPHNNEPPVSDAKISIVSALGTSHLPSEEYEGRPCFSSTCRACFLTTFGLRSNVHHITWNCFRVNTHLVEGSPSKLNNSMSMDLTFPQGACSHPCSKMAGMAFESLPGSGHPPVYTIRIMKSLISTEKHERPVVAMAQVECS